MKYKIIGELQNCIYCYAMCFQGIIDNVTLSPKEFQRIHNSCIPHHRDTSKCRCIPGKWLHFKRASHFHQSKPSLDVDEDPLLVYSSSE